MENTNELPVIEATPENLDKLARYLDAVDNDEAEYLRFPFENDPQRFDKEIMNINSDYEGYRKNSINFIKQ